MQQFKINADGFKEIRKRSLYRLIPLFLISIVFVILISITNSTNKETDVNTLPVVIVMMIFLMVFVVYRIINKQKKLLESYRLIIDKNLIAREISNARPISIYFNDIVEIAKEKNGSIIIKGKSPYDIIVVPAQIENYEEVELLLKQIKPFAEKITKSFFQKYPQIISLLVIGLMVVVSISKSKILFCAGGIILVAILFWSFYKIRINKNADNRTKQLGWWILVIIISVITGIISKLIGNY